VEKTGQGLLGVCGQITVTPFRSGGLSLCAHVLTFPSSSPISKGAGSFRLQPSGEAFLHPQTSLKGSGRSWPLLRASDDRFPTPYPYLARRLVWSPLRASSDHCFIVGALRAQRPCQLSRHLPPSSLVFLWGRGLIDLPLRALSQSPTSFSRVAWLILDCARRTSTFLSCAFREQEDGQATLLLPRVARAKKIIRLQPLSVPRAGGRQATLPILRRPRVARGQEIISLHPLSRTSALPPSCCSERRLPL
jgi:hypothetical protein